MSATITQSDEDQGEGQSGLHRPLLADVRELILQARAGWRGRWIRG